ncbi:MAG: pyrroloquinoline quinone-dependent dehydrogenase [Cytophagales bacterium]|nr:MAG: pyrroloquinoline quinone-dependent dehydrogenase [Cytophagales bacterium]
MKKLLPLLGIALILFAFVHSFQQDPADTDWPEYLGGPDRSHYSPLTQINTGNVGQLKQAWSYAAPDSGQMQANSIIVGGVLYGVTATVQVFALDAATGKQRWIFGDPLKAWHSTSRGVAYWKNGDRSGVPDSRIIFTVGPKLYAINAETGKLVDSFGDGGSVDMRVSLGPEHASKFLISNTPGTVFEDLIVMPTRVDEGAGAAPGYIQAFDVRTGKVAWTFHTIPRPGEFGYDTWPKDMANDPDIGGVNCWAGMAVDRQRGILYVPTGSASYDFYGGNRPGQNLFANCLLALDARTGKRLWHFQTMHHDIWDRDLPSPPTLLTVTRNGPDGRPRKIDAVAQTSKQGYVFVFDRVTGKPLFDINEVPVAKSTIPGETTWPTQPVPTKPAPYARQKMTEADINPHSTERDSLLTRFRSIDTKSFTPISQRGTLLLPGCDGGAEWGGSAADPEGVLYVNSNDIAWLFTMKERPKDDQLASLSPGQKAYTINCANCHGTDRKGNPKSGFPSLVNINTRRDKAFVSRIITNGRGMMPGFTQLSADEKQALVSFLFGDEKVEPTTAAKSGGSKPKFPPYRISGYNKFLDSKGAYAIKPPWGTLNAIDLNTGEYRWKIPLGEDPDLKKKGVDNTGTENYGGPVVTAGGLVFIAATKDEMFRAFDRKTGQLLWETKLPAAGHATPSTYQVGGKQYVVIACGGGKLGTKKGNQWVAFSL